MVETRFPDLRFSSAFCLITVPPLVVVSDNLSITTMLFSLIVETAPEKGCT
jgi:hypothetical protein